MVLVVVTVILTHARTLYITHQVICHGIPDMRELQEGDIVNIDVSTFHKGFHGDLNEVRRGVCEGACVL